MAAKILLVEDDKSLREIYGVRLQAEGYEIASASDGEQALAVAIKEKPALIITDVMMPKISGFDMLDILRSTAETKEIKVIMMTALSSDDQRSRGERMGADRYLVKSQVGIEDVVRTVHEVLGDSGAAAAPAAPVAAPAVTPTANPPAPATAPAPAVPQPAPVDQPAPAPSVPLPAAAPVPAATPTDPPVVTPPTPTANPPVLTPPVGVVTAQPSTAGPSASQPATVAAAPVPLQTSTIPAAPSAKQRIIQPLSKADDKVDINALLDKELAKEAGLDMLSRPQVATTDQEKAIVENQIQATAEAPTPPASLPALTPNAPPPTDRPASPTVPPRDTPLQTPPRIPTI